MHSQDIIDAALADCTEAQQEAIRHVHGPLLVLAGPGSGKTRVITRRIAHLVGSGVDPKEILAITFTNKAAGEMRERAGATGCARGAVIATFHSFCARVLRQYASHVGLSSSFSIYDTADTLSAVKRAMVQLEIDQALYKPAEMARAISDAKGKMWAPDDVAGSRRPDAETLAKVYRGYTRLLRAANAADFDDLLMLAVRLLTKAPEAGDRLRRRFSQVLIDEYQDTNHTQYLIAKHMASEHRNLCATGDPDQSIYGWRGADINNILEFERDYKDAKVVRLEQNYRSTKAILRVADSLIAHNVARKEKTLWTENAEGERARVLCCDDDREEADRLTAEIVSLTRSGDAVPRDIAVFYRVNAQSRRIEQALRGENIPYTIVAGTEFYQRKEIKDLLSYLRLVVNPADDVAVDRVANVPARRIGATSMDRLKAWANESGLPLLEAMARAQEAGVRGAALQGIARFAAVLKKLRALPTAPVAPVVEELIAAVDYERHLRGGMDDADDRIRNVRELVSDAAEYNEAEPEGDLPGFLEKVALVSDTDHWDPETGNVTLMTLHAAKGLEFPAVFVVGLEEGLLPLARDASIDDLEEERRLLFVGITRAKKRLSLMYAQSRTRYGKHEFSEPSRFLSEIEDEVDEEQEPAPDGARVMFGRGAAFRERARGGAPFGKGRRQPVRVRRGETEEIVYDGETPADDLDFAPPFRPGNRVVHPTYGHGHVVQMTGLGETATAVVRFPSVGVKKLRLLYAKLKHAGE